MLIKYFIDIILDLIGFLTSLFPVVTQLPFGIDSILVQGFGYIHFLAGVFPPIGAVLTGFLYIVNYKLLMMFIRVLPLVGRIFRH